MRPKTTTERDKPPGEAAVPAAPRPTCNHGPVGRLLEEKSRQNGSQSRGYRAGFTLAKQREHVSAFTLVELAVSVGVLVVIVLLTTQVLKSTATVTTLGHKQMDADSQARQLLDRMAVDFAQLVKRNDLDFFAKRTVAPNSVGGPMTGNDQIAFFSAVPGYYPTGSFQSPLSLVAYRINSGSNKMERMGKGLLWNAATPTPAPVVFMPLTIGPSAQVPAGTWPTAISTSATDPDYEVIGPQVFRFEYCYLGTDGTLSITPPGISSMAAIVVDIAMIDPKSKVLVKDAQLASLIAGLDDSASGRPPGDLLSKWQAKINNPALITWGADGPPPAIALSGIRLYERFFYLSPSTL